MQEFVKKVIDSGKPWIDTEFPPELSSLYDPNIDSVDESKYKSYKWKRLS